MSARISLLRGWPGLEGWKAPTKPASSPRLAARAAVVLHAAAERGAMPERFGLGASLVALGAGIENGTLIVSNDLDRRRRTRLDHWAASHPLATTTGPQPWHVVTPTDLFEPLATVERAPWAFQPTAYSGAGFVVCADLGRMFGLMAKHVEPRRKDPDAWRVWLPGWGRVHGRGRWMRTSPHRPPLYMKARRVGWSVEFAPSEPGHGKYLDGLQWRGGFVDLMSLAYGLDGDRGASFAEHRENLGLPPVDLPLAVDLDEHGAEVVTQAVLAIHELAGILDAETARWFR